MGAAPLRFATDPMKTYKDLANQGKPVSAGEPEVIVYDLFDSRDFASNFSSVKFFTDIPADNTLSNLQQTGGLPDGQYFELHYIGLDYLALSSIAASQVAVADLLKIIYENRGYLGIKVGQKDYGQFPISGIGSPNQPTLTVAGTTTADAPFNWGQFGGSGVGLWINGTIILPPLQTFQFTIYGAGSTTLSATRKLRLNLMGNLFRLVQ